MNHPASHTSANTPDGFDPVAAIAAAIFPGLGYITKKDPRRAIYVAVGVLGLFLSGILIGGIDSIDSREDRLWFYAQALTGPIAFATDHIHQNQLKVQDQGTLRHAFPAEWDAGLIGAGPVYARPAIGKVNDVGMLLCALAGMLNLIAIVDCAVSRPGRTANRQRANAKKQPAPA